MVCGICGIDGHNRQTCGGATTLKKKSVTKAKAKPKRRQMVWCLKDEVPYDDGKGGVVFGKKEEKIQCGCGGSYLPCGTAAGARSWRTHHYSKRHMRWDPLFN